MILGAVLVLALLGGLVAGLGGFERRTDLLTSVAPGSRVTTGPYEFTFATATAQKEKDYGSEGFTWKVVVSGTGRTTGDISIAPYVTFDDTFFSRDPNSAQVQAPSAQLIGDGDSYTSQNSFTPGLPEVKYRIEFDYDDNFVPGDTLRFVVFELDYRDNSLLGDQEKQWDASSYGFQYVLPLAVLAEKE